MSPREFELEPAKPYVFPFPLFIGIALPLLPVGLVVTLAPGRVPLPTLLPMLLLPVVGLGLAFTLMRRGVRLSDEGLRLRSFPWPRTIPVAAFDMERAEIANLDTRRELRPRWKIMGTRIPGFHEGRFRLADKRYASVLLTDLRRVLVLPRRDGGVVLLSLQRPEALLSAMRGRG